MWLRFLRDTDGGALRGQVVYTEDFTIGQQLIDDGTCARCLGPDGVAFGEAAPEDVQVILDEDKLREEVN